MHQHLMKATQRALPRPNGAPAYYLGRPARQWVTAMRPRRCHCDGQ